MRFIGVDIESTGNKPGFKVTQIGVAFGTNDYAEELVQPAGEWEFERWTGKDGKETGVEELIGITKAMVMSARPAVEVDHTMFCWLLAHGVNPEQRHGLIAVGWNVGSFDMPAVRRDLPRTGSVISYRSVDLNSLVFALVDSDNQYDKIKEKAKDYARRTMGQWKEHTAGGDAVASLLSFDYLRGYAKAGYMMYHR